MNKFEIDQAESLLHYLEELQDDDPDSEVYEPVLSPGDIKIICEAIFAYKEISEEDATS